MSSIKERIMKLLSTLLSTGLCFVSLVMAAPSQLGYDDTPYITNQPFRVHDKTRPQPKVITPPTESSQAKAGQAPSDAIVLFAGKNFDEWSHSFWELTPEGTMIVKPLPKKKGAKKRDIKTNRSFGDVQLHIEWKTPSPAKGAGQKRSNSGIFFMGQYEVQVQDNYDNQTYPDGQAGAIYGQYSPYVNASRGPGVWQTYDIVFLAPKFEGDKLVKPAYLTVFHNGVLVQHNRELIGKTSHKKVGTYSHHKENLPIKLQDHGDPVSYRNIWIREINTDGDLAK
jgi:hypothetical protein